MPTSNAPQIKQIEVKASVCTDCGLSETRTQVVFGEGNADAALTLIGEGPGDQEDRRGRPFVGKAGKLLDEVLADAQIRREDIWLTNVIKCRACVTEDGFTRNRPPKMEEIKACHKWLDAELNLIQPAVIVCIGALAANRLIHRNFKMTQERGRWFTDTQYAPFAIAALHPAYVLRHHGDDFTAARRYLVEDLIKAREKAEDAPQRQQLTLF